MDQDLGRPIRALAHELAHWMDYEAGRALGSKHFAQSLTVQIALVPPRFHLRIRVNQKGQSQHFTGRGPHSVVSFEPCQQYF